MRLQERAFEKPFLVSSITFQELEHIKNDRTKDEEIKYQARNLLRLFAEHEEMYTVDIVTQYNYDLLEDALLPITNDNLIISGVLSCKEDGIVESDVRDADLSAEEIFEIAKVHDEEVVFVTDDIAARMIAETLGVVTEVIGDGDEGEYRGYKEITGDSAYITEYMSSIDYNEWCVNEYLIIHNTDDDRVSEMRYDGERFVALRLPPSGYIKAKNSLQRCALDLLMNKDITTIGILGGYGSGKTYLAMQMALYHVNEKGNQAKILGVREATGEGAQIGFLKGNFEDKTHAFFKPLEQQLKGGEFELGALIQRGVLETQIPFYMKGTTYNDTFILVDEAEDLRESQIRLIGTRAGTNSRIALVGDYKQSLIKKNLDNPLVKMCREFRGNPKFGCIVLDEDVRSETSKMFAELFQK